MRTIHLFLFAFLLLGLMSCEDYFQPREKEIHRIINSSDYDVVIRSFDIRTNIKLLDLTILKSQTYEKDSILPEPGDDWSFPEFIGGDSAQIIFPNGKIFTSKCSNTGEGCSTEGNIFTSFVQTLEKGKDLKTSINTFTITNEYYQMAE